MKQSHLLAGLGTAASPGAQDQRFGIWNLLLAWIQQVYKLCKRVLGIALTVTLCSLFSGASTPPQSESTQKGGGKHEELGTLFLWFDAY